VREAPAAALPHRPQEPESGTPSHGLAATRLQPFRQTAQTLRARRTFLAHTESQGRGFEHRLCRCFLLQVFWRRRKVGLLCQRRGCQMKTEGLFDLLLQIETEDPIDYADLPFDEDNLRELACCNVSELMESEVFQSLTYADRELMAAATITKLVLENMVLNARLLQAANYRMEF